MFHAFTAAPRRHGSLRIFLNEPRCNEPSIQPEWPTEALLKGLGFPVRVTWRAMSGPNVSQRLYYRLVPGEPSEPTSTIVLTSKDSYFVDIRIFRDGDMQGKSDEACKASQLQWAFAGQSHTKNLVQIEAKPGPRSHTVWDHWVDSKDDDPAPDEGDMTPLEDGTVLEEGSGTDPVSGEVKKYEELWKDLPIEPSGSNQERDCTVLHALDDKRGLRGVVIKIGKWCQGIMKAGGSLTVERWCADSKPHGVHVGEDKARLSQPDGWARTFKVGQQNLPCEVLCRENPLSKGDETFIFDDIEWQVLENCCW